MKVIPEHGKDPKLIVLDLDLPKKPNLMCLDELNQAHEDLPVVVVTGKVEPLLAACGHGREQVLSKPF